MADDSSAFADLGCRLLRDDGAVVYLNGTEIWRDNLPVGPIAFNTRANVAIKTSEEGVFLRTNIPPRLLPTGTNVVAVEIHQVSPFSSTDVSFDFELTGTANLAPAQLSASLAANQLQLTWPGWAANLTLVTATNLTPPVVWTPLTNAPVISNSRWRVTLPTAVVGTRFYRLQAP